MTAITDSVETTQIEDRITKVELLGDKHLFTQEFVTRFDEAITEAEGVKGNAAVIITSTGKFFSNGLDLNSFQRDDQETFTPLIESIQRFFAHLLKTRLMVVTATNGHAFGMGALTHLCGDIRLTRTERGFWCLPEVSLGMPFTSGLSELVSTKLGRVAAPLLMTTGERLDSDAQVAFGVSHRAVPLEELDSAALDAARSCLGNSTPAVKAIKGQVFSGAIRALEAPISFD